MSNVPHYGISVRKARRRSGTVAKEDIRRPLTALAKSINARHSIPRA
jgi:hypothetical protein